MVKHKKISYGPVLVVDGRHKGRIGYYDDNRDTDNACIVYFGNMLIAKKDAFIPPSFLMGITTDVLMKRLEELQTILTPYNQHHANGSRRITLLEELNYIEGILADRMFEARTQRRNAKATVFISHSSSDKQFARWLSVDLKNMGYGVWLDEWSIMVGESIPRKIGLGINDSDFVIVILSPRSVDSHWVENEWHSKYWDEVQSKKMLVIPVLKERCKIPILLKTKKYANFAEDYNYGLEELLQSLSHHTRKPSQPA